MTVTEDGEDASTLAGTADATSSTTLMSKMPPSLSMDKNVTPSTTLKMYLPPTVRDDGIEQDIEEDDAAGDVLLATTEGFDDKVKRQI